MQFQARSSRRFQRGVDRVILHSQRGLIGSTCNLNVGLIGSTCSALPRRRRRGAWSPRCSTPPCCSGATRLNARFEAVHHVLASSAAAETKGGFSRNFDTVHLHRPTAWCSTGSSLEACPRGTARHKLGSEHFGWRSTQEKKVAERLESCFARFLPGPIRSRALQKLGSKHQAGGLQLMKRGLANVLKDILSSFCHAIFASSARQKLPAETGFRTSGGWRSTQETRTGGYVEGGPGRNRVQSIRRVAFYSRARVSECVEGHFVCC